jgi:hypothetical protein
MASILKLTLRVLFCIVGLVVAGWLQAAEQAPGKEAAATSRFRDPDDGGFDISEFLDTAYGFVPVIYPITEPAVGYGAVGALVFIDRNVSGQGQRFVRPNITAIGGLGTENGTKGLFALNLGTWMDGRLRTMVAVADADISLEFFGLGGDRGQGTGLGYTIAARGGVAGGSYRLGETPIWLGLRYARVNTNVTLNAPNPGLPGISPPDLEQSLAALTPSITLDMRNNFFTPTEGWYADLSVPLFRKALGGDRDFETASLTAIHYRPLSPSLFFSVRGGGRGSSDGTPFYLRPYITLRGVEAMRYQGDQAAEAEAELRWQVQPRFSLVGFAGAGIARSEIARRESEKNVTSGGAGFRYLLARKHGLHMGIDVARGPDSTIFYVVFGNAWMRP